MSKRLWKKQSFLRSKYPNPEVITLDTPFTQIRDDGLIPDQCYSNRDDGEYFLTSAVACLAFGKNNTDLICNLLKALHAGRFTDKRKYLDCLKASQTIDRHNLKASTSVPVLVCKNYFNKNKVEESESRILTFCKGSVERNFTFADLPFDESASPSLLRLREHALPAAQIAEEIEKGSKKATFQRPLNADTSSQVIGAYLVNQANYAFGRAVQDECLKREIPLIHENIDGRLYAALELTRYPYYVSVHSPLRKWWHFVNQVQLNPTFTLTLKELQDMISNNHNGIRI